MAPSVYSLIDWNLPYWSRFPVPRRCISHDDTETLGMGHSNPVPRYPISNQRIVQPCLKDGISMRRDLISIIKSAISSLFKSVELDCGVSNLSPETSSAIQIQESCRIAQNQIRNYWRTAQIKNTNATPEKLKLRVRVAEAPGRRPTSCCINLKSAHQTSWMRDILHHSVPSMPNNII